MRASCRGTEEHAFKVAPVLRMLCCLARFPCYKQNKLCPQLGPFLKRSISAVTVGFDSLELLVIHHRRKMRAKDKALACRAASQTISDFSS